MGKVNVELRSDCQIAIDGIRQRLDALEMQRGQPFVQRFQSEEHTEADPQVLMEFLRGQLLHAQKERDQLKQEVSALQSEKESLKQMVRHGEEFRADAEKERDAANAEALRLQGQLHRLHSAVMDAAAEIS